MRVDRVCAELFLLSIAGVAIGENRDGSSKKDGAEARWVEESVRLPAMVAVKDTIVLPLANEAPYLWRGISDGISVSREITESAKVSHSGAQCDGLRVSYQSAPQRAAGVAFVLPIGTLAGFDKFLLQIACDLDRTLIVSVRDANGRCYSFPSLFVRGGAEAREYQLEAAELAFDPRQSTGAQVRGQQAADFDAAVPSMLSIVDISSFFRPETRDVF